MNFYILNVDKETPNYIKEIERARTSGLIASGEIHIYGDSPDKYGEGVYVHEENGMSFLARYLSQVSDVDKDNKDQLIPSHEAPHVLAQVILILLESIKHRWKLTAFPEKIGLIYEEDLEDGIRAMSVTNEKCPSECSEMCVCPTKKIDLTWDIGEMLKGYSKKHSYDFIGFQCLACVENVCTIPMKDIIGGWLEVKRLLESKEETKLLVATYSKCHAIAALIETFTDS